MHRGLCHPLIDLNDELIDLAEHPRVDLLQAGSADPHARDSRQTDGDPNGSQADEDKSRQTFAKRHGTLLASTARKGRG